MLVPLISDGRDPLVLDLIDYFSSDKFMRTPEEKRHALLSTGDVEAISAEIAKIQRDFRYAASNYFWISNKEGDDILFSLWEAQELVIQKMEEMKNLRKKAQRVVVIKARQVGQSQLGCGLVMWRTVFFPNRRGLVASADEVQSKNLYNFNLQPMLNRLPWWLKPSILSNQIDEGIIFDRPRKLGGVGLNSGIAVQWANRKNGLGQGYKLNAFHGSEFTSWANFQEALEEDLKHALVNSPETIALLESTAKGAGTPSHSFYNKCVDLAEKSDWEAVFIPYFFESTRFLAPPQGWKVAGESERRRDTVLDNWCRCDNQACNKFFLRKLKSGTRDNSKCPSCSPGTIRQFNIADEQLFWLENEIINASKPEVVKQELPLTPEEAFVAKGESPFSEKAIENLTYMLQGAPIAKRAFFDKFGFVHGYSEDDLSRKCHLEGCTIHHEGEEQYLQIWEDPIPEAQYNIGVDVGYGKGKDYSVAWVNRRGSSGGSDRHVATLRSNSIDPIDLAYLIAKLGVYYNDAMVAIEYNVPGNSTADHLDRVLHYGNIYQDKINIGQKHWHTRQNTKPRLIVTMDRWLKEEILLVRDRRLLEEIKVFRRDNDSISTGAETGFNDDIVMAAMICLLTAHRNDFEDSYGIVPVKVDKNPDNCMYKMNCTRCLFEWGSDNPGSIPNCPRCNSLMLRADRNMNVAINAQQNPRRDILDMEEELGDMFTESLYDAFSGPIRHEKDYAIL